MKSFREKGSTEGGNGGKEGRSERNNTGRQNAEGAEFRDEMRGEGGIG